MLKHATWLVTGLTLIRIPLALLFFAASLRAGEGAIWAMLIVALLNELSDAADGAVARHLGVASAVGGIMDSGTDQIARTLEFMGLEYRGLFPIGFLALFIVRDALIMSLRQLADLQGVQGRLRTRLSGKLKGIFQGCCIVTLCIAARVATLTARASHLPWWAYSAIALATVATAGSLVDYVVAYISLSRSSRHDRPPDDCT